MSYESIYRFSPPPAAAARELVRQGGHFPTHLVLRGLTDPKWAYHVSACLQEMEKDRITDPSAQYPVADAATIDFLQQEWENDTLLPLRQVSADEDGRQDHWFTPAEAHRAYERYWERAGYFDPRDEADGSRSASDGCRARGTPTEESAAISPEALGKDVADLIPLMAMLLFVDTLFRGV